MRTLFSRRRYELLALGVGLCCAVVHLWSDAQPVAGLARVESGLVLRGLHLLEGRATDLKFRIRGERSPHPDVLVVEIDERSTQQYGLWPWSRSLLAEAVRGLHGAGAKAIGFDIAFVDETKASSDMAYAEILERFERAAREARPEALAQFADFRGHLESKRGQAPDLELARAFEEAGPRVVQGVIAYPEADLADFSPERRAEHVRLLTPHVITRVPGTAPNSFFEVPIEKLNGWKQHSAQTPLLRLAETGTRFGHFNMVPDPDGTLRRVPTLAKLTEPRGFLPSLALQTAAAYLDAEVEPLFEHDALTGVRLRRKGQPPRVVPYQNNEPFTLVNHLGPASAFKTLSIADVIAGKFDPAQVRGKAVLLGITVVGHLSDQRVTPFRELEPGIFSHAALLSNILSEDFLTRPAGLAFLEALAMILAALLLGRAIPRVRSFGLKAAVIASVLVGWAVADQALFAAGVQLATVLPATSVLASSFGLIFLGYLSVDREKLKLRETFSKYLGEDVMDEALRNPEKLSQGEKREMTVLFSDIRGFTTLSERMLPEKLADFIKQYLNPMTRIVFDEKGTLDKYIGDAVMAFWNAPLDQPDHALRACRAAVKFLEKLEELKQRWRAESYPEFDIGVGINSGPMIVGNMGSDVRVDYTVLGDAVNLASRLEGTNKEYDTRIIFSESTYLLVQGEVIARRLGAVRVKGKRKPVRIYELRGIGRPQGDQAEAIRLFEAGVDAYAEQRFDDAARLFQQTLEIWPGDGPCRRYLDEITLLKVRPPGPGWDGVYTATTK